MAISRLDTAFAGSVPQVYERYMVPLIFEPYALDIAQRMAHCQPTCVLEVAAGTGVVSRALARLLPSDVAITATDLNQPMLDHAAAVGTSRPIEWRQADVMRLPFADRSFDAVVCQFGAMFFPDKPRAFSEVARVLRPGGTFLFNVWDRIEHNELADSVTRALAVLFPDDPPRFLAAVPHGYWDPAAVARDLASGGFKTTPEVTILAARSRTDSPRSAAVAFCQGTPLRAMLEARGVAALAEATDAATRAIDERFGTGAVDATMQAHVFSILR
jgi:SAM-dependent methyltransferase